MALVSSAILEFPGYDFVEQPSEDFRSHYTQLVLRTLPDSLLWESFLERSSKPTTGRTETVSPLQTATSGSS